MIELGIARGPARELRADATTLAINAIIAGATGASVQTWAAAAVECAAGLWARCLSAAAVEPADVPIGPGWLAEMARDVARKGEAVYLLDIASGARLRLLRASQTDVWGDSPDPADWWYRLTVTGPRTTRTVTAPAAAVVHVRYATEAHSPARGLSPLRYASLTGTLTANLEQSLGYEAGGAVARIIALPEGLQGEADDDDDTAPSAGAQLSEEIRTAKGRTLLPETTSGGAGDRDGAPRRDWESHRLGADPPVGLVQLRREVESSVLACFGVPAPLGPSGLNDGTAQREAARRLWATTIGPLGAIVGEELSRVLERPVTLDYSQPSGASDVAGRARAVGVLAAAGVPLADALERAGWPAGQDDE